MVGVPGVTVLVDVVWLVAVGCRGYRQDLMMVVGKTIVVLVAAMLDDWVVLQRGLPGGERNMVVSMWLSRNNVKNAQAFMTLRASQKNTKKKPLFPWPSTTSNTHRHSKTHSIATTKAHSTRLMRI
ncbi:hypothetical protein E2C01_003740 [Portunus trituberculatus]|uniref:Uncharacterized protein n=1 Tax=Portunus trituberculatus TaxID=210409 RepID=A0A5B7CPJ9_PORTR|nr:hypothetical protein [Portunus trituberculatus]